MIFNKVDEKNYKVIEIGEVIEECLRFLNIKEENYPLQRDLVYNLLLNMITYKVGCEFNQRGITINNNINLVNVMIPKEEFFYNGVTYRDKNLNLTIGYISDIDITGKQIMKTVFGRND